MSRKLFISFHIAPELLEKIRLADPDMEIMYNPSLLGKPRYRNDQHGGPIKRTPEQEEKLQAMIAEAEILFGYVPSDYRDLGKWFPKLRWNQSPSAGIGWGVKRFGWTETDIDFTTASARMGISSLIVVKDGKAVGIITERDMMRSLMLDLVNLHKLPVRTFMSTNLLTIKENASIEDAIEIMVSNKVKRLPVINTMEDGSDLIGILSMTDIVNQHPELRQRFNELEKPVDELDDFPYMHAKN